MTEYHPTQNEPAPFFYIQLRGFWLRSSIESITSRDYKVFLEPDADYGGYVVVCPSIPGCYSQGKTVSEALANIREAIEVGLEDMESRGEEIPDPSEALVGSVIITR